MSVKQRLIEFINYKQMSKRAFALKIGASPSFVNNISKSIGGDYMKKILDTFPELNREWLIYGDGEMIRKSKQSSTPIQNEMSLVPLLPVAALGGTLNDFVISVETAQCEKMLSPVDGIDFAMTIKGDSMNPEYPNGSIIFIKRINERAFIEWGKVYVLDTRNGSVIKKVMPADDGDKEKVKCVSTNEDFPPFEVRFDDMYGMYRVVMCMSMK